MAVQFLETWVDHSELQMQLHNSVAMGAEHMLPNGRLTLFHGLRPPPITIEAYLERIAKYSKCSASCFVLALMYLIRVAKKDTGYLPTALNVHRCAGSSNSVQVGHWSLMGKGLGRPELCIFGEVPPAVKPRVERRLELCKRMDSPRSAHPPGRSGSLAAYVMWGQQRCLPACLQADAEFIIFSA